MLLLFAGLYQQVNLILLVFTLSAGPFLASIFGGRAMLRRLSVSRRVPSYVFSGDPLVLDYTLENGRRWFASLAVFLEDSLVSADRSATGNVSLTPRVFFARVAGRDRVRMRWQSKSPRRGKYRFRDLDLGTRSPFGLVEHRVTISLADQILIYPTIGHLTRRWFQFSGRPPRTGAASGTTDRRCRLNITACAITVRETARAGSTGARRRGAAS